MKYPLLILAIICLLSQACGQNNTAQQKDDTAMETETELLQEEAVKAQIVNKEGTTINSRFNPPEGFKRIDVSDNSYAGYLRQLPLKHHGAKVKYFDGSTKSHYGVYSAVVDLDIGKKDLHQCADAVMRLRAEYLWNEKKYDEIHFNFTNGFRVDYSEWMSGKRIIVKGNKTYWSQSTSPSNTYKDFWKYMEIIFSYAGSKSLSKELIKADIKNLKIGDVFIIGGFPGHTVIIVDIAENSTTKEKIFMLAQSYMPAQEIQILINPNNKKISPWYSIDFGDVLKTPEWNFNRNQLMRFED